MATYHLYRWLVHRYPATTNHPAYADVTLHGHGADGFLIRRPVRHWERLRISLLPTDTADMKGNKVIVKRAMAQSADTWKGHP